MKNVSDTTYSPPDPTRPVRWLLLAMAGVIGALLVAARLRRTAPAVRPAARADLTPSPPLHNLTPQPPLHVEKGRTAGDAAAVSPLQRDARAARAALDGLLARRAVRWALFAGVTALVVWLLLTLDRQYAALLLLGMALVTGGIGVRVGAQRTLPPLADRLRQSAAGRVIGAQRGPLAHVLGAGAITLVYVGVQVLRPVGMEPLPEAAFALIAGGGLMLGAALRLARGSARVPALALPAEAAQPAVMTWAHRVLLGGGLALMVALALVNGPLVQGGFESPFSSHLQFAVLCAGLLLTALGLGGGRLLPRLRAVDGRELLVVALVTAAALALRFWELDTSIRMFVDELNFATPVRAFDGFDNIALLVPFSGIAAFPFIFPYWQAISVEWFGHTFTGLRGASAIVGALTIPAVYLLGRALYDRKTALAAAILLAAFPPHLHFSRIGMNNIADPLFATLGFAFLARGITQGRRAAYAAGGVLLGLTHYFYEGGRLLYWPLAAAWLVGLALLWRPRLRAGHLLVTLVAALIVAVPIYTTLASTSRSVAARAMENDTALDVAYWRGVIDRGVDGIVRHVRERVVDPFLIYVQLAERSLFYRGNTPLILTLVSPLFVLGVLVALWRLRAPGSVLLLLWVAVTSLGNSLMVENMHSPRYVVAFPALMLLAAVGLRHVLALVLPEADTVRRGWRRLARPQWIALVVIAAGLALYQADYYFNRHVPVYNRQLRDAKPFRDPQDAVLRSLDFPKGTQVHIISRVEADAGYTLGFAGFFREDLSVHVLTPPDLTPEYVAGLPRGVDNAFFVEPGNDDVLTCLRRYFYLRPPQASPYPDLRAKDQFTLYYAPYMPGYSETLLPPEPEPQGCPFASPPDPD